MKTVLLVLAVLGLVVTVGAGAPVKSVILEAVQDVYVVSDASKTEDPEGLRDKNFGSQDFIRVWYAWKVQKEEQIISISLIKFDLAPIRDREVQSATLQLFATRADMAQPARLVDAHLVEPGQWSEREVNFNKRPVWGAVPIATSAVYGAGVWYSWDVSESVARRAKEGAVSYALGLRAMEEKKEEQVAFASREVGRNAPRLIVTYVSQPFSFPIYIWGPIILVVAVLGFLGGRWFTHRRRPAAGV